MARSAAKRSLMPGFTMSFRWMTPRSLPLVGDGERRAARHARSARPPGGTRPASCRSRRLQVAQDRVDGALADRRGRRRRRRRSASARRTARLVFAGSRSGSAQSVFALGERHDRAAFRRFVGKARRAARPRRDPRVRTPATGMNSVAMRLPKVIVPVLSSSSVSTSPAASTARPEVAITLKRISRSMPAMPMADSRPPMVVGMRQTSSAISTVDRQFRPRIGGDRPERHADDQEDDRQA